MLDDLFSSARGPGIIGLILATFVLAFLCVISVSAFTEESADKSLLPEQRTEMIALRLEIENTEGDIARMGEYHTIQKELEKQEKIFEEKNRVLTDLTATRKLKLQAIEESQAELIRYRNKYRTAERTAAVGETIDLSDSMGTNFKDIKITRINPAELGVMTVGGPKRLLWEDLPANLQDRFQFDAEEATQYRTDRKVAESNRNAQTLADIKNRQAKANIDRKGKNEKKATENLAKAVRLRILATQKRQEATNLRTQAARARSAHASARARGNPSSHLARASDYERQATAADNDANRKEAAATQLESSSR